jgi:hypothetical protein
MATVCHTLAMPALLTARFELRPDAKDPGERALHELASSARRDPDAAFTAWREAGSTRYLALLVETDIEALRKALAPYLAGEVAITRHELVTSSDLAPRRRRPR